MYEFFVGCDISKKVVDVAYYENGPIYLGQFSNCSEGFIEMCNALKMITTSDPPTWFVCFENTGIYSKSLVEYLASQMVPFREENALLISKSLGMRRGKNDKSDAIDLCQYCFEKRDSLKTTILSNPLIVKLGRLLSKRELLVKQKTAIKVSFNEQKPFLEPDMLTLFQEQAEQVISLLKEQIKQLEKKIKETMQSDEEMRKNDELAQSVVGIGPIQAAFIIYYSHNFKRFQTARQFASYAGVAPFLHGQSGVKRGTSRVSHLANKNMKSLLGMGAKAAIQFDKEINAYYHRKLVEGKASGLVINNVKNKLIQRVFAAIKRQSPFVKLMNYA